MLELSECIVEEAENGNQAINKLINHTYDLILMDIQMPEMDGIEATKIIRTGLNLKTPIIALTANSFQHDIDKYFDIGMNDFIIKPFEEDQFYAKIIKNI
jgi:CheY-like chemotaxis protein